MVEKTDSGFAVLDGAVRDWATRLCGMVAFLSLALAGAVRADTILHNAAHGIDAMSGAQLFATLCLAIYYVEYVWFTLIRGAPVKRAAGWQPRVSAMLGTFLALGFGFLPPPMDLPIAWHYVAAALLLLGSALAAFVVLPRLGRSFSLVPEARQLVTTGPYRIIRHPLYLVEEIAILGAFIEAVSFPAALLLAVQIAFQIRRIFNEEALLEAEFPEYAGYMASRARLIPGIW
jgi:protein-S-isoprenylcysteine O-methyltransferase Ste14